MDGTTANGRRRPPAGDALPPTEVTIGGTRYATPFAGLFRALTADESAALEESVREVGFRYPVLTYDSAAHGPALIDGLNRAALADRIKADLYVQNLGAIPDAVAEQIATDVNAARRQLTPEQVREARARRVARVAGKRAEGKSFRTIAAEEGIGIGQVQNDLKAAADSGVPIGTPESVIGRDGKEYPASKSDAPVADDEPGPAEATVFRKSPQSCADEVKTAVKKLRSVRLEVISSLLDSPYAPLVKKAFRGKGPDFKWDFTGEERERSRSACAIIVTRLATCHAYDVLIDGLNHLEHLLLKEGPAICSGANE